MRTVILLLTLLASAGHSDDQLTPVMMKRVGDHVDNFCIFQPFFLVEVVECRRRTNAWSSYKRGFVVKIEEQMSGAAISRAAISARLKSTRMPKEVFFTQLSKHTNINISFRGNESCSVDSVERFERCNRIIRTCPRESQRKCVLFSR